jgi:membrane-bound lytic murein transglycosylase B
MKQALALCFVFSVLAPSPPAQAKRVSVPIPVQKERKAAIVAHIRRIFSQEYADTIVNDPRFTFNGRFAITVPEEHKEKPKPRPKRHNFDYVVNKWSKTNGLAFLEDNQLVLLAAEEQLGVPKEIVVGILDAETQFGEVPRGKRLIVQSLLTLAVFRPDFQQPGWSENELIAFLRTCERNGWDVFSETGSWTGARGKAQFEPTSYELLAMHYDGDRCVDGRMSAASPDLFDDADVICSIANYLNKNGWSESNASQILALYRYNHNMAYGRAIRDVADYFAGRPPLHRYQLVARPRKRILRAAAK